MSNEGTADLCRWLRDNSSGIYRNAATAATVIESQHAELIERQSKIDRLTSELAEAKARAVIPDGWAAVPMEPITGENYENGLWSRRNWTAALEDMLSARPDPKESSE